MFYDTAFTIFFAVAIIALSFLIIAVFNSLKSGSKRINDANVDYAVREKEKHLEGR